MFAHYEGSLGARWSYGVGLRHDTMTVFGRTKALRGWGANQTHLEEVDPDLTYRHVSPRGELRFRPGPRWSLTGSLGRGVLPPRPSFAERCCSARYQRNRQLRPERAWSSQLQAEWRPTPSSQLTLTGFWTEASDYHEKIVYQATAHVPLYAVRALPEVRLRGVELGHDLRLAKGRVEIGWATVLVDAEVTDPYFHVDELTLEPVLADGEKIYLDEHGAELRYIPGLSGRATFKYSGRRGTTVDVEARYTGPVSHFRIEQLRLADTPWSIERSEAYWRVDARVERELGESGWSGYVGVDNLTDYVMPDLGDVETTHEWGPRTGRFVYLGARYRR
ncbi:MAG: TonB-dependent receptor [Acidobacteriota bacterium]